MDGKTELRMLSYEASKIGVVRSLCVDQSDMMQHCVQVLDLGIFPRPEIDLPIFCANFFTTASMSIIVLDLDLLHDVINQRDYKEKYYKHLIPLGLKYAELLPGGVKITNESLRFFSLTVNYMDQTHKPYRSPFQVRFELMDKATEKTRGPQIMCNLEAQRRYPTWRAEKDPGYQVLTRLIGETRAKQSDLGYRASSFIFLYVVVFAL
ncbi:unnamed protein product [Fraxinus pennsylvanica]|uniref:Uncharacterized protein n=1 Tax=Fraxinus pennsylvanica TaxID=56036 RepID=A0AAD1ZRV4_9LAMI|nr:unnamed protein product [Fraxinus pennsylvanica]